MLILNLNDFLDFTSQEGLGCVMLKANWDRTSVMMSIVFDKMVYNI